MKALKIILLITLSVLCLSTIKGQNLPCSEKGYITDTNYFRLTTSSSSMDATTSKKKAMMKARTNITSQITSKCLSAVDSQMQYNEQTRQKIKNLIPIAIRQEVSNMKIICEDSNNISGKFISNLVVEVSKDNIIKRIITVIEEDNSIKGKFDSEKYSKAIK